MPLEGSAALLLGHLLVGLSDAHGHGIVKCWRKLASQMVLHPSSGLDRGAAETSVYTSRTQGRSDLSGTASIGHGADSSDNGRS